MSSNDAHTCNLDKWSGLLQLFPQKKYTAMVAQSTSVNATPYNQKEMVTESLEVSHLASL